ncbi:alanyl-tRNA editing protein [Xenorhabdus sp. DI]|uniref:alanyl-tRNA editing protein n=1 Tax=Xenorhabdus doucetiae TaxID=351671 RepID=UPI0019B494C5|nr:MULTISPECIES: alanyl-tRNA editing protein [unclassified Xenorhabdus]MBD2785169.1 alanyl-tRNA editing protein [Xenorhabdus sp. 3]MBD2787338.1 alanyl-tRNA editing protein [Xenorhabdus sp. DI]
MKYDYDSVFRLPFTERTYNKNSYSRELKAKALFVEGNIAVFDKTIFYAESGGQVSDIGKIITPDHKIHNVIDVQHKFGSKLSIKRTDVDVPFIDVETRIVHFFSSPVDFKIGDIVTMSIEWDRRYSIMKHHTLAHFLFYAFNRVFNESHESISVKGCSIDENKASFSLNKKISMEAWETIKAYTLEKIHLDKQVIIEPEAKTDTIFYWRYDDLIIPCGGTHIEKLNELDKNSIFFHKKNAGKDRSRVYISNNSSFISGSLSI